MEANQPPTESLPTPATRPASGTAFVHPPPTLGRCVYFTDRRLLSPKTSAATVTAVLQPGAPDSHVHLLVMPACQQAYPENGVAHFSKAKPNEPYWDWPPRAQGGS